MFIKKVSIKNFRLFGASEEFSISDFNIPDGVNGGSGLNVIVGENGCGKTALLDALTCPVLEYKAEAISLDDFNDQNSEIAIQIFSDRVFEYDATVPRLKYKAKGFEFQAKMRARENRSYLSTTVVSDQRFLRADGEARPEEGKPDLRLKVDNPWIGSRFTENDILYLDKNRTYQIRSGMYNPTRFDRLMEDYNFKHIKDNSPIQDIDSNLIALAPITENDFLKQACQKFEDLCGQKICISLVNNYKPYKNSFFAIKRDNSHQIPISEVGSGYEMIFTFLYSYFLSQQSGKKLILIFDEPELHLHPKLQEDFANLILEFSKTAQIFIATHSALLVKQIMANDSVLVKVLNKTDAVVRESNPQDRKLPYTSANEINYIAFQLPTEEYHNELYEELKNQHGISLNIKAFDINFFQGIKSQLANYPYNGTPNQVSLHTHVRTQIHHRGECGTASLADIKTSIETMRGYL